MNCTCERVRTRDGLAALQWVRTCPEHPAPIAGMAIYDEDSLSAWRATTTVRVTSETRWPGQPPVGEL